LLRKRLVVEVGSVGVIVDALIVGTDLSGGTIGIIFAMAVVTYGRRAAAASQENSKYNCC
jgi:hypothetical protein